MAHILRWLIALLLYGGFYATAMPQTIEGPKQTTAGYVHAFALDRPAKWLLTPVVEGSQLLVVDTSGTQVAFASPIEGRYTLVAAYVGDDGEAGMDYLTFWNTKGDVTPEPPKPDPPTPKPDDLKAWVVAQAIALDKTRLASVRDVYKGVADAIAANKITNVVSAMTNLNISLAPFISTTEFATFQLGIAGWLEKLYGNEPSLGDLQQLFNDVSEGITDVLAAPGSTGGTSSTTSPSKFQGDSTKLCEGESCPSEAPKTPSQPRRIQPRWR